MRIFITFLAKNKFKILFGGFVFVLVSFIYFLLLGKDIIISNPEFHPIKDFGYLECMPLVEGGAGVWDSIEEKHTKAWSRESQTLDESGKRWIAVVNEELYLGHLVKDKDENSTIEFTEQFELIPQENLSKLLASRVAVVGPDSSRNVEFETLILDKNKGILSFSTNNSTWFGGESITGYNEVYGCKEISESNLKNSKGLPKKDNSQFSKATSLLDGIPEIVKIKQKIIRAGNKPFYADEDEQGSVIRVSLRESFLEDGHTTRIETFDVNLSSNTITVEDIVNGGVTSLKDWQQKVHQTWEF